MDVDQHCSEPRFFNTLQPGFTDKLAIPSTIIQQISKSNCSRDRATLVSTKGKIWLVDLYLKNKVMYMRGEGWYNFVHANGLEIGFSLVFRYKGNMVFNFRAYDLRGCEITCSSHAQKGLTSSKDFVSISDEEGSDDDDDDQERRDPILEASFKVDFKEYNRHKIRIPIGFIESSGLSKDHREICIIDPHGQAWQVGVKQYYANHVIMCKGWTSCARANQLKEGDKVIFELISAQVRSEEIKIKLRKL